MTVNYTLGGSAGEGDDYLVLGTIVIAAGDSQTVVSLSAVEDTQVEGTETVELTLTAANGYTLNVSYFTAAIDLYDNDF